MKKFRDPKTGKVFNSIEAAVSYFRCPGPCMDCPLAEKVHGVNGCVSGVWWKEHPVEAARRMGYEVIDDKEDNMEKTDNAVEWKAGDKAVITGNHNSHNFKIGETVELLKQDHSAQDEVWICKNADGETWYVRACDMKPVETVEPQEDVLEQEKPRLAEVLGVEVGERFRIGDVGCDFWIESDGWPSSELFDRNASAKWVVNAINHPEKIIRLSRLTESEIAIMRAVGAKWVSRNQIGMNSLHLWDKRPGGDKNFWNGDAKSLATVAEFLFPSVKPGDCICLEEWFHEQGDS